jgi:hypothetical protein
MNRFSAARLKLGRANNHISDLSALVDALPSSYYGSIEPNVASGQTVMYHHPDLQQRGSNENTNGLLRQYFPKNTDLTDYSQSDLNKVALRLNQRPRQTLGFQTPASKLQESVASTH